MRTTDYYNSILTLADRVSFYDKHHLVPFAEYFPVPGVHPLLAAVHESAVLGLHARNGEAADRRRRRHATRAGHLL